MTIKEKSWIEEAEFEKLSRSEKKEYIKEWGCICNECRNKWHYLDSIEKEINFQTRNNSLLGLGMCCNPCVALSTSNANTQLSQQKAKLKSCPKCGSSNVTRNAKFFKKQ
ncbi:Uncharacterised protein [uncultured archaeon]|nr:Uncharacterised protein [uncultured archaeon]